MAIEHYGSAAVPGLRAKPILDLQVGVAVIDDGLALIEPMAALGYDYAGSQGIPDHHIFARGVARTHLVHVVVYGTGILRQGEQLDSPFGHRRPTLMSPAPGGPKMRRGVARLSRPARMGSDAFCRWPRRAPLKRGIRVATVEGLVVAASSSPCAPTR